MIGDELADKINEKYPNRKMTITVSEDGENGATIEYEVQTHAAESHQYQ